MTTGDLNKSLKEVAMDFLRLASSGDVRRAYDLYVARDFKHHNPYFKSDSESLMKEWKTAQNQVPTKNCLVLK